LRSFGHAQGGPFLRNPYDIATGQRRYNRSEWEALGFSSPQPSPQAPSSLN
jgi:hypothetical protein